MKPIIKFEKKEKEVNPEKLEKQKKAKRILINAGKAVLFVTGGAVIVLGGLVAVGLANGAVTTEEKETPEENPEANDEMVTTENSEEVTE